MNTFCVLKSGGDFLPIHVLRLAEQVPGITCLSDTPISGVTTIPLKFNWPGWWSKMEAFRPDIEGNLLLIDLDSTVIRLPSEPSVTTVLPDFYRPELMGSGFMYLTAADRKRVWAEWIKDPIGHMARCRTRECWGDQGFLNPIIGSSARWGEDVRSYKLHCRHGVPEGTSVICYHGMPRPWDIEKG